MMKFRQRGVSLIGAILVVILIAIAVFIGIQTVSAFSEYAAIKHAVKQAVLGRDVTEMAARSKFQTQAAIDNITSISSQDLAFRREGGLLVAEVQYTSKVPLVSNVNLAFDFNVSSKDP
ncbi:MAG: DUF4845 domain-containing protein [Azoarcus sp.]|jgi:type II secretory pathway pseudopilin PulG|nr:DUF4845 domain-containing protein [Azoarcus sp.]